MIVFIFDPMYSKTENQKFAQYLVKNRDRDSDFETETIEISSYISIPMKDSEFTWDANMKLKIGSTVVTLAMPDSNIQWD